jgi:hypothetical protein
VTVTVTSVRVRLRQLHVASECCNLNSSVNVFLNSESCARPPPGPRPHRDCSGSPNPAASESESLMSWMMTVTRITQLAAAWAPARRPHW